MTADERIEQLLKRAGCPMMVVHSDAPATKERHTAYLIDRLEVALENALNERDALLEEVKRYACGSCKHRVISPDCVDNDFICEDCTSVDCPCKTCDIYDPDTMHWEWRGVPDKEDADE